MRTIFVRQLSILCAWFVNLRTAFELLTNELVRSLRANDRFVQNCHETQMSQMGQCEHR